MSIWTPDAPRGVVLLQHGYGEHAGRFQTQHHQLIDHLLAAGIAVWAPDMLGHGRSPGPRAVVDVRQAVRDHQEVRGLLAALGLPVVALGHSLGGLVTAASITASPDGVAGVVLTSPALPDVPPSPVRRVLLAASAVAPGVRLSFMDAPASGLAGTPGHEEMTRADPLMDSGPLTLRTAATALAVAADVWDGMSAWSVPTLVLHGTADEYTDLSGSTRFVAEADGAAELDVVEEGLHELLADLKGDAVLARVLGWIDSAIS